MLEETTETINENMTMVRQLLQNIGSGALDFLLKTLAAVLVFWIITRILNRFCRWLDTRMQKRNLDPSMRSFILSIVRWGILIFTVVQIIITLDIVEASSIAALIASAGVGVSLAVQGTLSNFAGGILLLCLRPFKTGDFIEVPALGASGTVTKIEMYYTTIWTVYHEAVMIPNSSLTNNQVTNYTALGKRVLQVKAGVSYHSNLPEVKRILENVLREDGRVNADESSVFVSDFGEDAVIMEIRAMVSVADYWPLKTEIFEKIKYAFDEAGIEIPFRQMDLHLDDKCVTFTNDNS